MLINFKAREEKVYEGEKYSCDQCVYQLPEKLEWGFTFTGNPSLKGQNKLRLKLCQAQV